MPAAYDSYNYPSYWEGREYEHRSELISIKSFLNKIKKIRNITEIGAGFGRLTSSYSYRAKKVTLVDPSPKLLSLAKKRFPEQKYVIIQSTIEKLPDKLNRNSADLIILVRVLHHIEDLDIAFSVVKRLLKKNGYLILEFANKRHGKAAISEFFKGNLTFLHDIMPKEVSSRKTKKDSLPFRNYHPDAIQNKLQENGFKILEVRSTSNIRSPFIKKILPIDTLLFIEKLLQIPLAKVIFGPSIFILAQNKG